MISGRFKKLNRLPLFLYLLPVFFVLHGFTDNFFLVPVPDSLLLLLKYLGYAFALHIIFYLLSKQKQRAAFFSFTILLLYFFFGAFHDTLRFLLPGSFFSGYAFVLPFLLLAGAILFVFIRRKKSFEIATRYFNFLFIAIILIDVVVLSVKMVRYDRQQQVETIYNELAVCDSCATPDIYLIVTDAYAGEKALKDLYGFDNSDFLNQLRQRKFHIVDSSFSNYTSTPISIASLLNMDYVRYEGKDLSDIYMRYIYQRIDRNVLVSFLRFHDYRFINNSMLTVGGKPPFAEQPFTPVNTQIIESQTLTTRLMRDLGYFLRLWGILPEYEGGRYRVLNNNKKIMAQLKEQVQAKREKPVFSYSHLTMPHAPYYFDSKGNPYPPDDVSMKGDWLEEHYLEYLQYSNGVFIELIDFILKNSPRPPVIILIGDHGFRRHSRQVDEAYDFYNLNATFLPDGYAADIPDGLSNISYMRALVNVLFQQHLSLDKQEKYFIPVPGKKSSE